MKRKTREIVFTALMAAFICLLAPLSVPLPGNPVPVTLATFAVYLVSGICEWKTASLAVLVYLLLGMVGIPVFASFTGGVQAFAGPTGGYLVGYLPMAALTAFLLKKAKHRPWAYPAAMICATALLYVLGTAWFMIYTGMRLPEALGLCVVPFLATDGIKIAAASALCPLLYSRLSAVLSTTEENSEEKR